MPRRTQVNYYASRGAYFCQLHRRQHKLAEGPDDAPFGPTYLAALTAFRRLLEEGQAETAGDGNTLRVICEHFMSRAGKTVEPSTQERRQVLLAPLVKQLGEVRISHLQPSQIDNFLDEMRKPHQVRLGKQQVRMATWGDSTVCSFLRIASACLNWAIRQKLISSNPFKDYPRPLIRSRGRDCLITPEQHQIFLRLCRSPGMRQIMIALENTGARPGEILAASAADWDENKQAIVYYADTRRKVGEHRHKTAKHKDRTIFFSGNALELIRQLIRRYPRGALFRHASGHMYRPGAVVNFFVRFRRRKAINMPTLSAYSYRHTFATNWLLAGRSIEVLAELLGNTPAIIRKHYAHLCSDYAAIRRQLEDFRRPGGNNGTSCSPDT